MLNHKHIVYFEDNMRNRSVVQMILERNGARVSFLRWDSDVNNILLGEMPVDLILTDLMFPEQFTGYELLTKIRANRSFSRIPVVAISAADPAIEMTRARQKGFDGFISKPISVVQFPEQIASVLRGQKIWQTF